MVEANKSVMKEKLERSKTGGVECAYVASELMLLVRDVMGDDLHPLSNEHDSDVGHHVDVIELDQQQSSSNIEHTPTYEDSFKLHKRVTRDKICDSRD